jgi:uncharacterized protein (TIGR03437 family)
LPPFPDVQALAASGTNLFAGIFGRGVFHSNNDGRSWRAVNTGLTNPDVLALAVSGTSLFAGTFGGVFRSNNNGESWTAVNTGLSGPAVRAFAVRGTDLFAVTQNGVFRSNNNGGNWTAVNEGLPNLDVSTLAASGTNLFAGTFRQGVFLSTNGGESWLAVTAGLHNLRILALAASGPNLFAGTDGSGVFISDLPASAVASVSAASFSGTELASEAIVAAFGAGLATSTATAASIPLPTTLAGTTVTVADSAGVERPAPLFFVSPAQVNYLLPPGTAPGPARVTITSGAGKVSIGTARIAAVAPGLFAANANGQGVAAAVVYRLRADGAESFEPVARFDAAQNRFVAAPIDLGPESDQVFLVLFGSGIRFRSSLSAVTARVGGADMQTLYAGAQGGFAGLDQVNVRLARSLAGRGEVDVSLTVDGKPANTVIAQIR